MKGTFRLVRVMGINIDIHSTFLLLLAFFFLVMGVRGLILILGVFFFVTIHELCHSLVAARFGIKVKHITLLPIGGVASMPEAPRVPYQELLISLAGPLSNMLILVIFYYPLLALLGKETLIYPLRVMTGQVKYTGQLNILAHIYWINLVLAVFNMLPSFPMDGGRVLRAILSYRIGYREATAVAVRLGHIFALLFAYLGIVHGHIFLLIVAVFVYMAASSEGFQVEVTETIKNYSVRDILARDFIHVRPDTPLSKVLELIFRTHQEDYPVIEDGHLRGFITRREIIRGIHEKGKEAKVEKVMRGDIPAVEMSAGLHLVQKLMQKYNTNAMPVKKRGNIVGVVTKDDINRVYLMMSEH
ncbi:MAG: hypothetical protein DRP85_00480 [Candidatus Makaraimicrobium thalassicum]|nr:MAG: hypothetical protein DRP85_00480 [Candidatus Omnitrophota bacterium]